MPSIGLKFCEPQQSLAKNLSLEVYRLAGPAPLRYIKRGSCCVSLQSSATLFFPPIAMLVAPRDFVQSSFSQHGGDTIVRQPPVIAHNKTIIVHFLATIALLTLFHFHSCHIYIYIYIYASCICLCSVWPLQSLHAWPRLYTIEHDKAITCRASWAANTWGACFKVEFSYITIVANDLKF